MTEPGPAVSVIVPAYNAAGFLAEALESVAAQTFEDWEVVVCDDGSSDDTAAVAEGFGPRVHVIRNRENEGLASARNRAIAASRGALLALLDADDAWLPEYLERQVARLAGDGQPESVGIVCCNAYLRDARGRLPGTYADRFGAAQDVTLEQLFDISPIFISALIPRRALEEVGVFDPSLRSCEDLDLWIRLLEAGYRVLATHEPLVVYRLGPGQLSARPAAMARARRAVYERAIARGRLSPSQRRLAERAIRREEAVEAGVALLADLRARHLGRAQLAAAGVLVRAIAENPSRWWRWALLGRTMLTKR